MNFGFNDNKEKVEVYEQSEVNAMIQALTQTLQDQINTKANVASPTFTGTPKAPTPANTANNTQLATTAFVNNMISTRIAVASCTMANASGSTMATGECNFPSGFTPSNSVVLGVYPNAMNSFRDPTLVPIMYASYSGSGSSYKLALEAHLTNSGSVSMPTKVIFFRTA